MEADGETIKTSQGKASTKELPRTGERRLLNACYTDLYQRAVLYSVKEIQ